MTVKVEHPLGGVIAGWQNDDGYQAFVWPAEHTHGSKRAWWWQLVWQDGSHLAGEGECIFTPEHDETDHQALSVLTTLANFLSAWEEALHWESRYPGRTSDNGDLFPRACIPFEPAIEEFSMWAYEHGTTIEEDHA